MHLVDAGASSGTKLHGMPLPGAEAFLDQHPVFVRIWHVLDFMPAAIARYARSNDITNLIFATVLSSGQMFSSTLKSASLFNTDFVQNGKATNIVAPHWITTIVAATFLAFEGSRSGLENFWMYGHCGFLN
ncbi:hypothetical protein [Pseudomonas veronii]